MEKYNGWNSYQTWAKHPDLLLSAREILHQTMFHLLTENPIAAECNTITVVCDKVTRLIRQFQHRYKPKLASIGDDKAPTVHRSNVAQNLAASVPDRERDRVVLPHLPVGSRVNANSHDGGD